MKIPRHILRSIISMMVVLVVSFGWQTHPSLAAEMLVTANNDTVANNGECSLPEAIINANNDNQSGSTDCPAGFGADVITLNSDVFVTGANTEFLHGTNGLPVIRTDITIEGSGFTIERASTQTFRLFAVDTTATFTLNNTNVRNGYVQNSIVTNASGGAISNSGILVITNSVFTNNFASYGGAAISNMGVADVINTTLRENSSDGTILNYAYNPLPVPVLTVTGSTIAANTGAGIVSAWHGNVTIDNTLIGGDPTLSEGNIGSGIKTFSDGTLTIQNNSAIMGNISTINGGGLFISSGTATISDSLVTKNTVINGDGGGIYSVAELTISNTTISYNTAQGSTADGGGIVIWSPTSITDSVIAYNSADSVAGGITTNADTTIQNTRIEDNNAGWVGGIENTSTTLTMVLLQKISDVIMID